MFIRIFLFATFSAATTLANVCDPFDNPNTQEPAQKPKLTCPKADELNRYITVPFVDDRSKLKVYYRLERPYDPEKETLLMIPGGPGGDHRVMQLLKNRDDLNIVSFDHRGVGCTKILTKEPWYKPGMFSMARAAGDLDAIRKDLLGESGKWWVYGISYGTFLGQRYAFNYPDHIKGLILDSAFHDTKALDVAQSQYKKLFIDHIPRVQQLFKNIVDRYPDAHDHILKNIFRMTYNYKYRTATIPRFLECIDSSTSAEEAKKRYDSGTEQPLFGMFRNIACEEIFNHSAPKSSYFLPMLHNQCGAFKNHTTPMKNSPELKAMKIRTMIWGGAFDPVTPIQMMREMHTLIPNSTYWENPHAGHGLIAEKEACSNSLISEFVAGASDSKIQGIMNSSKCQTPPGTELNQNTLHSLMGAPKKKSYIDLMRGKLTF